VNSCFCICSELFLDFEHIENSTLYIIKSGKMIFRIIKNILILAISISFSYLVCYYFFDDILTNYVGINYGLLPFLLMRLLFCTIFFTFIKWMFNESKKYHFDLSIVVYTLFVLFITLIGRDFGIFFRCFFAIL